MNKKLIVPFIILLLAPVMVFAAADNLVVTVIDNLLSMVVWPVFIGLVVIMFIWAGILYLTARGDPEKFKKANLAVIFAIIGIIVAILGYKIVATVQQFVTPPETPPDGENGEPPATGACCWADTCSIRTRANCSNGVNQIYYGDDTDCTGRICPSGS